MCTIYNIIVDNTLIDLSPIDDRRRTAAHTRFADWITYAVSIFEINFTNFDCVAVADHRVIDVVYT